MLYLVIDRRIGLRGSGISRGIGLFHGDLLQTVNVDRHDWDRDSVPLPLWSAPDDVQGYPEEKVIDAAADAV